MNNKKQFSMLVIGLLILIVALVGGGVAHADTGVFINEIHYDNASTDEGEAIEIAGLAGTDLSGWSIVLYNGSTGASYGTMNLNGVIPNQQDGFGTLSFSRSGIQNGSPDGLALVDDSSNVVQFLSYEGSFTVVDGPADGMTSTDIGVAESSSTPVGHSLQLAGTGSVYEDFTWTAPTANTFGAVNTGQTFIGGGLDTPPSVSGTTPNDGASNIAVDANITVNFSEDVTVNGDWFNINCTSSGELSAAFSGGPQNYTLDPDSDFADGEICTVTVFASRITDEDDTPDNMTADYVFSFTTVTAATGGWVINEIHADPASGSAGDANGDGTRDDSDDEFVEIVNNSDGDVDISGWTLSDAIRVRHIFPAGSVVSAHCAIVVFGGGSPTGTFGGVIVQTANSGGLGLNNSGDTVTLNDGSIDQATVTYGGGGGDNQSLTRDPDITGSFVKHSTATGSGGMLFSPGTMIDGSSFAGCGPVLGNCGDPATLIHDVQGNGATSPLSGTLGIVIEGVVVGDFQGTDKLRGFFLQEEDGQADSDPATSEGIFVYDGSSPAVDVNVGDVVRVMGNVTEYYDLTELNNVSNVMICNQPGVVSAATITLPIADVNDWEWYEGMLINIPQTLYVTENYSLGHYGEVELSAGGRLDTPTNVVAPGTDANDLQGLNDRSRIQLDDGSTVSNPLPLPPYLGDGNTLRTGDTIPGLTGVLDYYYDYQVHPTEVVSFTRVNTRDATPPDVGGALKVASFNVLNYFNGDGLGGGFPTSRGAETLDEFNRQRAKIISAISTMDADIIGLMEIENDAPPNSAIEDLVEGLNVLVGPNTYNFIDTGIVGDDEIRVAFIYKPGAVTPVGPYAILDSSVDSAFNDQRNRPALAQTFKQNSAEARFTVVVNHLKSKGTPCTDPIIDDPLDPDTGDGQGNCNLTRKNAAIALANWLATAPTGSSDPDFLIIGDLNSYAKEDPIDAIKAGGYTNLIEQFIGDDAYSYVFYGQSGYLDHALANASLTPQVTGVVEWHINADEPAALDYNDYNQPGLYNSDQYRASDHDPVLIGLNLETEKPTAITLISFKVEADNGQATITWETGTEIDNAGFNLYRAASPNGPWFKLNASLIAAEGDPISGASYTFVDTPGRGTFYYRLEDVDYFGLSTQHNPVMAELGAAVRAPWFRPSLPKY